MSSNSSLKKNRATISYDESTQKRIDQKKKELKTNSVSKIVRITLERNESLSEQVKILEQQLNQNHVSVEPQIIPQEENILRDFPCNNRLFFDESHYCLEYLPNKIPKWKQLPSLEICRGCKVRQFGLSPYRQTPKQKPSLSYGEVQQEQKVWCPMKEEHIHLGDCEVCKARRFNDWARCQAQKQGLKVTLPNGGTDNQAKKEKNTSTKEKLSRSMTHTF